MKSWKGQHADVHRYQNALLLSCPARLICVNRKALCVVLLCDFLLSLVPWIKKIYRKLFSGNCLAKSLSDLAHCCVSPTPFSLCQCCCVDCCCRSGFRCLKRCFLATELSILTSMMRGRLYSLWRGRHSEALISGYLSSSASPFTFSFHTGVCWTQGGKLVLLAR